MCGVRGRCAVCMVLGGVRWCSVVCGGVGVRWCAAVLAPGGCPRVCRKQREADTGPESPQEPPEPPKTVNRQEVLPGVELDLGAGAGYRFPAPAVPKVSLVLLCDACFPPIWDSSLPGLLWVAFSTTLPGPCRISTNTWAPPRSSPAPCRARPCSVARAQQARAAVGGPWEGLRRLFVEIRQGS